MLSLAATKRRSALSEALSPERGVEHYRAVDAGVRPRDALETSVRLLNRAQPRRVRGELGELGCLRRGRPVRGRHLHGLCRPLAAPQKEDHEHMFSANIARHSGVS